jgi:methylenetetrahydrofolate dehydrogenase (NADP+)/methenyltetrahydrofolate cyclohydrolase
MSTARILDGKALSARLIARIAQAAADLKALHGLQPGLAVVLVGHDPASEVYVRNKTNQTESSGLLSREHRLDSNVSEADVLALVDRLNRDESIHGILVQLPLPAHINAEAILEAIAPAKDVDGFHPVNAGRLATGQDALVPCTPQGCMYLINEAHADITGLHAVVVGRSNIVGKPVAQLLLAAGATVTIAHSRTRDLPALCRQADILVVAVGKPDMVRGEWIKPGATVIDVGINRVALPSGKSQLTGDVNFKESVQIAGAITPVPGGVGPMTIACLLANTIKAACRARGLPVPELKLMASR